MPQESIQPGTCSYLRNQQFASSAATLPDNRHVPVLSTLNSRAAKRFRLGGEGIEETLSRWGIQARSAGGFESNLSQRVSGGRIRPSGGKRGKTRMEGVVLVTDSMSLPGSVVTWALQTFQDKAGCGGQNLTVITRAALIGGKLQSKSSSLDVVVFISENSGIDANEWVVEFERVVKPGGVVFLQTRSNNEHTRAGLERSLLLAGFLGVEVASSVECWGSSDGLQPLAMKARKPTWEAGSSFALKKRSVAKTELDGIDTKIQLNDDLEDLIDEDSLLSEEDLKKPELPVGDCEVGATRKACKNCTCGRAEMEGRRGKLGPTSDQLNNPQSACGSCGLGDAFRCNGCPYKGLPPFKLGEKITLTGTLLTADV